jgi:hypothetical protein
MFSCRTMYLSILHLSVQQDFIHVSISFCTKQILHYHMFYHRNLNVSATGLPHYCDYLLYSKACDISYFLVFESIENGHILTTNNALDYIILIKRILEDYVFVSLFITRTISISTMIQCCHFPCFVIPFLCI